MDPEEFMAYIDSLPISVQQSMMQYMMAGGDPNVGGTAPFGAGPMNTGRLGGQVQGPLGVSPYDPMSVGAAYAYTPQLDKYGNEQPFDLGTAQQNLNLVQDQQGSLFNSAMMMQGGEGVYAPGTFEPVSQPGEYDTLIGTYATYGPDTYQGFIAERVASGVPPEQALNEFWAAAQNPENPQAGSLLASLPTKYVQQSNPMDPSAAPQMVAVEGGDKEAPQRLVYSLSEAQMKQTPPQYGAVAQEYIDQGIPFPTERYGQGSYSMESEFPTTWGAGGHSAITAAQKRLEEARAAADPKAIQKAQAKYLTGANDEYGRTAAAAKVTAATPPGYSGNSRVGYGDNINPNNLPLDEQTGRVILPREVGSTPSVNPNNLPMGEAGAVEGMPTRPTAAGVSNMSMPPPDLARRVAANMQPGADSAVAAAQKQLESLQGKVWNNASMDAYARNKAMNKLGRTPTQDTLMARQLVNYMMGVYGPRG